MAKKMYYTEEEAAAQLGVSAEQRAAYIAEKKIRVYQDGMKKMFKAAEIDALATPTEQEI